MQHKIFGLPLYQGSYSGFLQKVLEPSQRMLVFTPNPEILLRSHSDDGFHQILCRADFLVPDGNGIYVAYLIQEGKGILISFLSLLLRRGSLQREYGEIITGSRLTRDIFERVYHSPRNILIIDRKNEHPKNALEERKAAIQPKMKEILEKKYPGSRVSVLFEGEGTPHEMAEYIQMNHIQYVFCTTGMKSQESLLSQIFGYLSVDLKVVGLGVGASIDYLTGLQSRPPMLISCLGFEWLYRLLLQPRIRAKRIFAALITFPREVKRYYQRGS